MLKFKKLVPMLNRILIQKPEPITKTSGGILLAEDKATQLNIGKVVATGPGKHLEDGTIAKSKVSPGETVLLPEWGGIKVTLGDGIEYHLYRDEDIVGTLHDPTE